MAYITQGSFIYNNPSPISDFRLIQSILLAKNAYAIPDLRACFESYCYTKDRCAVCEDFYLDEDDLSRIELAIDSNITFCCKRCLFNGWLDVVNYLREQDVFVCKYPMCLRTTSESTQLHTDIENKRLKEYVRSDLEGIASKCADRQCHRIGCDISMLGVTIDDTYSSPVQYQTASNSFCSRKHAMATRPVKDSPYHRIPENVHVSVACNSESSTWKGELHNTYHYNPIYYKGLWFHTLYHALEWLRFKDFPEIREVIRKQTLVEEVRETVKKWRYQIVDQDELYADLERHYSSLLWAKFMSNTRMYLVGLYYSNSRIEYSTCLDGVNTTKCNKLMSNKLRTSMQSLVSKYGLL